MNDVPTLAPVSELSVIEHLTTLLNTKTNTVGQKRVNASKKFVVYKHNHEGFVYKGPYSENSPGYQAIIKREKWLRERSAKHVLYPLGIAKCANTVNKDGKGCLAFVFPDLMDGLRQYSEPSTWYVENKGISYHIQGNNPYFMKLSTYIEKTKNYKVLDNYELLKSYVLLFILETGDVGLHNTIVTTSPNGDNIRVHIIDYEDNRVQQRDDSTFYFNKASAEKYKVYEHFAKYYKRLAAELFLTKFESVQQTSRAKDSIHYLEKYSPGVNVASKERIMNLAPKKPSGKVQTTLLGGIVPESDDPVTFSTSKSERCRRGPEQLYTCGSMRGNNKTLHGYTPSVIKSALQKNIRRGFAEQAIASAFELWQFQIVDATMLVNNMYNRLRIIACEDISPRSLQIQAYVCQWVRLWTHEGKTPFADPITDTSTRIDISGTSVPARYNPVRLAGIVYALSVEPKSRIGSHLFNAYTREHGVKELRDRKIIVDELTVTDADMDVVESLKLPFITIDDIGVDGGKMAAVVCIIYRRLIAKDPNAVRWIHYFLERYGSTEVKGRKRKTATILLWELYGLFIIKEILEPIRDSCYDASEKRPIWMCVACNILVGIRDVTFNEHIFDQYIDVYRNHPGAVSAYVNGQYTLAIEDYMLDKHTGKKGDPIELQRQFVLEGARVNNQDPTTYSPNLKEIYENLPPPKLDTLADVDE